MYLMCKKCETPLTADLYPNRKWQKTLKYPEASIDQNEKIEYDYSIKKGTYVLLKHAFKNLDYYSDLEKTFILVSQHDILDQSQLVFESGNGCCGNSWVEFICPCCKTQVADQFLDCYEDKHIRFNSTTIIRQYKK